METSYQESRLQALETKMAELEVICSRLELRNLSLEASNKDLEKRLATLEAKENREMKRKVELITSTPKKHGEWMLNYITPIKSEDPDETFYQPEEGTAEKDPTSAWREFSQDLFATPGKKFDSKLFTSEQCIKLDLDDKFNSNLIADIKKEVIEENDSPDSVVGRDVNPVYLNRRKCPEILDKEVIFKKRSYKECPDCLPFVEQYGAQLSKEVVDRRIRNCKRHNRMEENPELTPEGLWDPFMGTLPPDDRRREIFVDDRLINKKVKK